MILAILLFHLVLGSVLVALGDRLGRRAFGWAVAAPALTLVWLATQLGDVLDGETVEQSFTWIEQLGLVFDLRLDALSAVMVLLVSGIGLLVCIFAVGYFTNPKPGIGRLAGLMTVFAGAMLGVVLTDHLIALFVFWELTSITSYLLIGNDDTNPRARDAALTAILITGGGGLAMLAGLVLIGQAGDTYRISELVDADLSGSTVGVAIVLVLIGAFTKSAQAPFSGWLPGAMVAPTPISAYLHAATMVKAGVYLVARLAPAFGDLGSWRPLILIVSGLTMVIGGWRALRQHDLKLLLAYGTVSQLGFMMLLLGMGEYELAQAGIVLLIAHGAFKAALFMVVGIVDHQVGTRDVRDLQGFGPGWNPVIAVSVLAAASMAGIPPLLGFIAKEKGLDGALHAEFDGAWWLLLVLIAGSILTVAYSGRFVLGVVGRLAEPDRATDEIDSLIAPPPTFAFAGPAILLAVFSLVAGVAPVIVDELVRAATTVLYAAAQPKEVVLWAGVNTALWISMAIIAAGVVVIVARRPVAEFQDSVGQRLAPIPDSDTLFWGSVTGTSRFARAVTSVVQNGSLPVYLMVILSVAAVAPLIPTATALDELPAWIGPWEYIPIAAVVVAAALGATLLRRRIAAVLALGAVGFAMALFYAVQGAPDLALTQFAIETLVTVMFVLVLRFLPRRFADVRSAIALPVRLVVAGVVGVSVFALALVASAARSDVTEPPISDEMLARSVPDAKGANVVNVILVDFRGLDTLGEITVLAVAALGTVALARVARRPGTPAHTRPAFARLPVLDASARLLYPSMLVLSLYFLFVGHNQPGGGFVGGLTAGAAISLRYVAGGI